MRKFDRPRWINPPSIITIFFNNSYQNEHSHWTTTDVVKLVFPKLLLATQVYFVSSSMVTGYTLSVLINCGRFSITWTTVEGDWSCTCMSRLYHMIEACSLAVATHDRVSVASRFTYSIVLGWPVSSGGSETMQIWRWSDDDFRVWLALDWIVGWVRAKLGWQYQDDHSVLEELSTLYSYQKYECKLLVHIWREINLTLYVDNSLPSVVTQRVADKTSQKSTIFFPYEGYNQHTAHTYKELRLLW